MWSRTMALSLKDHRPAIAAVNPGSMLDTEMVDRLVGRKPRLQRPRFQ